MTSDFYDLVVSILLLFDFYISDNENLVIKETFEEDLCEIIHDTLEEGGICILVEVIKECCVTFGFSHLYPFRSYPDTTVTSKSPLEIQSIKDSLRILSEIVQPDQRTPAWYEFRHNLITASNAYKMFGSQSQQDSLIYEKCQPIKVFGNQVSEYSPLHHGQKYEPVSIALYEQIYNTQVGEFGCVQHPKYSFLGASPDGINTDEKSSRYGRMLEIKNVVSREITGIPKQEYWVQIQLQMETCNLNETDFLETKFVEYSDEQSFLTDNVQSLQFGSDGSHKGIILQYIQRHELIVDNDITQYYSFLYSYMPLQVANYETFLMWQEEDIQKRQTDVIRYSRTIYWKLCKLSCVLVVRNQQWFHSNVETMSQFWKVIEKERVEGCSHRAPKKRGSSTQKDPLLHEIIF